MAATRQVLSEMLGLKMMRHLNCGFTASLFLSKTAKHKSMCYLDYVCSWLLSSYVPLNMTISLSITFY